MKRLVTALCLCLCLAAALLTGVAATAEEKLDSAAARKIFAAPPREYATAPLWVWNDMLTEEQIRGTMRDLAGQKVMQVFVHPRPGLMTPVPERRVVPALEGRAGRGRKARHERLDLRRELVSIRVCRRACAGSHARVARSRAGFP